MNLNNEHEFYNEVIDKYNAGEVLDYDQIREMLLHLDSIYSEGNLTPLTDEEYDKLHQIYTEYTGEVIRGDTDAKKKAKHDYPALKGTLKKVHYITQKEKENDPNAIKAHKVLYDWYSDTFDKLSRGIPHYLGFWPKYDGCSIILSLDKDHKVTKAITRGDEDIGIDKSELFHNVKIKGVIPRIFKGPIGLKTEAIMRKSLFEEYNDKFGDPSKPFVDARSAMTSLLNSETFTELHRKYVSLKPLMMFFDGKLRSFVMSDDENGPLFTIPSKFKVSENEFEGVIHAARKEIDKMDFKCDGIVVRWYDESAMDQLGRDNGNYVNKFEVAYKFPKENNYTRVVDIIQDIGLMGKASFIAVVEPIKINGKTITHASLGSYDRAKGLQLAVGDLVNIRYEIIPYLCIDTYCDGYRSKNEPIQLIDTCPYCGEKLEMAPELSCTNLECPSRVQGKLYTFCVRMNLIGIGESMIEDLFRTGIVRSIPDFFTLCNRHDEFCSIEGFGEKTWKKICKQFKNMEATQSQILSAVGIPGIGPKNSKKVLSIYHIEDLLEMVDKPGSFVSELMDAGITTNIAEKLEKGIEENKKTLKFLIKNIKVKKEVKDSHGIIVFTGFRNARFKTHLENLGYTVADSMSASVGLVVAENPDGKTGKLEKARKLGIPVIGISNAYEKFHFKL